MRETADNVTPEPPGPPVRCKVCTANGRTAWLTDPLSGVLEMGPTCARRAVAAHPGRVAAAVQLALDLGDIAHTPARQRRRRAAAA